MAFELASPLCFLLLLLLLPFFTTAQTDQTKNISLGSTLTALHNKSFWASPSGDFAFGFREIANGDNLVSKGSAVELTADGRFMLNDVATGKQISVADFVGTGVSYAAMLDTGNFILANRNSTILWQTNRHNPTLQILNQKGILFAHYTPTNYSKGRFRFALQSNGQIYWSTETKDSNFQVIYNMSGSIYLTARNRSILHMISSNTVSFQDFYQRATLDYDGVLRHYVYPKSAGTSAAGGIMASTSLSFIPPNICITILQEKGGGACGYNSICRHDQGIICQCPPGYSFIDPDDVLKGCKKDFVSQSCDAASPETDQFHFQEMQNTDWPESEYEKNGQCWLKGSPLLKGRVDPVNGVKGLVKIRKDNSTLRSGDRYMKKKDDSTLIMVGTVLLSSSGFLNLLLLLTTYFLVSRFYYGKAMVGQPHQITNLKNFTHKELEEATNGFKEELGRDPSPITSSNHSILSSSTY
ncbi:hypothetical protein DVH24_041966 [Malus domestica]|uniref:Bulb-type lectin domain-containing protein n=1 Tax=Malus domestica TaxID=3750 RepID=A0A498INT7_MALDO|nr:hypothetical protein DVH24_041966 [Malus domestica]